jgi:hypothetical protein
VLFSLPWSSTSSVMYVCGGWVLMSIALGLKGHIYVALNLDLIYIFVSGYSRTWSTHPTNVILFSSLWLFLDMDAFLTFLNVVLNALKQDTFNGWRTCMCGMVGWSCLSPFLVLVILFLK